MKIAVYMNDFIYKYGGSEGYTANLIEVLQNIFVKQCITILTESYKTDGVISETEFAANLNNAYGLKIKAEFIKLCYIPSIKTKVNEKASKIVHIKQFLERQKGFFKTQKTISKITRGFDLFINGSRYSFYGNAAKNVAVVHFPKEKLLTIPINKKLPWCKVLAKKQDNNFANNTDLFVPNSNFTSYWLTQKWQITDDKKCVLYPPVTPVSATAEKKRNQIFVCSRIEATKKIDLLLKAFESSEYLKQNCTLVIAGSVKGESKEYIENIQKISPSAKFYFEPSREEIEKLYAESEIFWHAKGINEENPLYFEHFGITTVEAISAGCVPIVINKGGQKEIVNDTCGFKWNTTEELVSFTENLVRNHDRMAEVSKNAVLRSELYSKKSFEKEFRNILKNKLGIDVSQ